MMKRLSMLSGRLEDVPDQPASNAPQDHAAQIADLRVQLATAQAQLEAARSECAALTDRLAKSDAELAKLRDRPTPKPAPVQTPTPAPAPSAYEVTVIRRDADGRLAELQLTPTAAKPPKW